MFVYLTRGTGDWGRDEVADFELGRISPISLAGSASSQGALKVEGDRTVEEGVRGWSDYGRGARESGPCPSASGRKAACKHLVLAQGEWVRPLTDSTVRKHICSVWSCQV